MGTVMDRPVDDLAALETLPLTEEDPHGEGLAGSAHAAGGDAEAEDRVVKVGMVAIATTLACLGAAWMVTRVFRGSFAAPSVAVIGILIGVSAVYVSHRFGRGGAVQYAAIPGSLLVGAVLATTGETAGRSLPTAIVDAFRGGGLLQPPIPFDAGWRFLVVVLFAFLSACACGAAINAAKPKLAVAIPMPLVIGGALIQPKGTEIVASAVATVFVVAALAIAYGADLASEGVVGGGFETRRLLRGTGLLAFTVVGLVLVSQSNFLFPDTKKEQVIPPQRPPTPPPEADRVLFTVKSDRPGPWRLGVLDVYRDNAFMLPAIDPKRLTKVPSSGLVGPPVARPTYTAAFTIDDVKGQTLPAPSMPADIDGVNRKLQYDPETQVFKLVATSVPHGLTYTVTAPKPPDGKELAAAPPPAPGIAKEFGRESMPAPPPDVQDLLSKAPTSNTFDRLQFVRQALYSKVVAAGGGKPVDVVPARVEQMLNGGEATPFEINAAEVMLSRWAGVPARLGFGYYGGEQAGGSTLAFRPKHGAAWLEAYFEGYGWVPILGTPPKAKSSLSNQPKKNDPKVVATDELGLTVYVPVELQNIQLLYQVVRYYVATYGPILLALLLILFSYPALLKRLRAAKRRRWAAEVGPAARVVVAYAELRDVINDLNSGDPRATPVELLDSVDDDDEHEELAWLVTRAIWGDLARDLRIEDVEAAEEMSRSVTRRILREQSALNRVLAATARASLRDPWTDEIPNMWPQRRPRQRRRGTRRLSPRRRAAAAMAASAVLFGGCAHQGHGKAPATYIDPLMPTKVHGLDVVRETKVEGEYGKPGGRALVTGGRVFTLHENDAIQGSVQFALFKKKVDTTKVAAQAGVLRGLGSIEAFRPMHIGTARLEVLQTTEQQIFVWFPPERNAMELFIMRKSYKDAEKVVASVIAFQRQLPGSVPS